MAEFVSHYTESDVEAHLEVPLTDAQIDHFQDYLPPNELMVTDALAQIDGNVVSGAICYLGRIYDVTKGDYTTLSWVGFRVTRNLIHNAFANAGRGRPGILTSRREISEALAVGRRVTPSRWVAEFAAYPPITVVAWYLKESVTGKA